MAEAAARRLPWGRFLAAGLLVALDLWSKARVFAWMGAGPTSVEVDPHGHVRHVLVEPWLALMLSCNPGAAFGQLGSWPRLLVTGRALAIVVLAVVAWRADRRHWPSFAAIVLVLAGAAGNLCDNLFLGCERAGRSLREVRDFLDVWFVNERWGWDWHFPTFNVADSCITVGACLWILSGLLQREPAPDPASAPGAGG